MTMDSLFDYCVHLLEVCAKALGMTYEEVNIWIFVIIEPIVFILMCFWISNLYGKIRKIRRTGAFPVSLSDESQIPHKHPSRPTT